MRSLLSASVISVGAVDSCDLPMDEGEDASAKVDAAEIGSILEAPIDPDFTDILPGDPGVDDTIFYCGVMDGDFGIPVEFVEYEVVVEGEVLSGIDSAEGEIVAIDDNFTVEDTLPIEDWDPSWLYRTLMSVGGDGSEEFIVDQGTGWEDGLDCGVATDGPVLGELVPNDFDGNGMPDEFVMYAFDPLPWDDFQGEPVEVIYFGGLNLELVDGEVAVEFEKPASDPSDDVDHAFIPEPLEDVSGEPVDGLENRELLPIRTFESSDFDTSMIFSSAAGGIEVQRTFDNGSVQEETVAASTVAIPARPSASNSLFNVDSGRSSVGTPVGVQSTLAPGNSSNPAKRNATPRRSSAPSAATRSAAASEGLNILSPLLGGDAGPAETDAPENPVDSQPVESGSIEETVSDSGNAYSVASGFAANQPVSPRSGRAAMIDRVMAQYAENSLHG